MDERIERLAAGAIAGVGATLAMTAVMVAAKRVGIMRAPHPPEQITRHALAQASERPRRSSARALSAVAHLAFGAGAGSLFSVAVPRRQATPLSGVAFGAAVWTVSYAGWIPALGLMPPPEDDEPGRPITMVAAHAVYGATLGALVRSASTRLG